MLIELHCHTLRYSPCSALEPALAVRRAVAMGLGGLVLTEHEVLWSPEELAALRREAEVGSAFVLLAAQEVVTDLGHVLIFGADRSLPGKHSLAALREAWPDAALVWAHPYRHGRKPADDRLTLEALDGVEIFNANHTRLGHYRAITDWHRLKFTATAGSDAHAPEVVGRYPAQLDHPVRTVEELTAELRAGRVRPFVKEIPRAGANDVVTEIIIGTKGPDEGRERIIVRHVTEPKAWRRLQHALEVTLALGEHGFDQGPYRVPGVLEVNAREHLVVEESQRGKLLYDLLGTVSFEAGHSILGESVRWLAHLHGASLRVGSPELTLARERRRARSYARAFQRTRNPWAAEVKGWLAALSAHQERLLSGAAGALCQTHGDYHPKNIIVGFDLLHDPTTRYVSVIDFAGSQVHHPAFDLGYLFAQLRYQLRHLDSIREAVDASALTGIYREALAELGQAPAPDLDAELPWFELRALVSMAAFLIKVGKGVSDDMEGLMGRARTLWRALSPG